MKKRSIDLLFITRPENIYYLTNYQTVGNPLQVLLVTHNSSHLITRELESTNAKYRSSISYSFYDENESPYLNIVNYIKKLKNIKVIGFEYNSERLTYLDQIKFHQLLVDYQFKDCSTLISKIRSIKTEKEIEYMKKAAEICLSGIKVGLSVVKPNVMETHIAGVINKEMMSKGCEYTAYPCFVASGKNGCMGHYTPDQTLIKEGDLLFMEIGACYKRYHAAKMHTVYVGNKEPEYFKEARYLIKTALRSVKTIMKPGVLASKVDKHMRDRISHYQYPYKQSERSGYCIGIGFYTDWAENDILRLYPTSDKKLKENMTIHLIPWIQLSDQGAIGFSDTVLVTKDGAVSLFTEELSDVYERSYNYLVKEPNYRVNELVENVSNKLADVLKYYKEIEETRLVEHKMDGINLYIKDESNRLGQKSFKILGVKYALNKLDKTDVDTLVTMTDGNHGMALAYLAKEYNYSCVIYVPKNISQSRLDMIKQYGAKCIQINGTYDDAMEVVKRDVEKNNWMLISDASWLNYEEIPRNIMLGYCQIFEEINRHCQPTHIYLQVGVGGFASAGIIYSILKIKPMPKIICVEPIDADSLYVNVTNMDGVGRLISDGKLDSIMTGLNCGNISSISWETLRDYVSTYITIGDYWSKKAMRYLYHQVGIYSGESGSVGLAGLMVSLKEEGIKRHLELDDNSKVVIINTEGITDECVYKRIIRKEL